MMHIKAIEIIARSLRDSVKGDPEGRAQMALGQYIAGMGFSNVGLGIVHSMAHPLSAVYDIPHGVACAILLTPVLKFNAPSTADKYRDIAVAMGVKNTEDMSIEQARQACIEAVEKIECRCGNSSEIDSIRCKRRRPSIFI